MLFTPLGPIIAWSLTESHGCICDGLDDKQGRHIPDPSPEQMAECLRDWRKRFELPGEVWGLEFVYLDGGSS